MPNRARLFAVIDKLFALLPKETGFEPYSFVAFAYGDDEAGENLRRSFRYELDGCCTHVTVEAPRRSAWRRRLSRGLADAGYEPWLSDDSSEDLRRWLRTASERRRELQLLARLGPTGAVTHWPSRIAISRPAPIKRGRWSRAQWARVVDEVRESPVDWDDIGIGFSRSTTRLAPTASGSVTISVGLLNWWSARRGKTLHVIASVIDPAEVRKTSEVPPRVARLFRRVLRENGFKHDGARSGRDGKVDRRRIGFDKRLTSEVRAVRACERIYEALLEVAL